MLLLQYGARLAPWNGEIPVCAHSRQVTFHAESSKMPMPEMLIHFQESMRVCSPGLLPSDFVVLAFQRFVASIWARRFEICIILSYGVRVCRSVTY